MSRALMPYRPNTYRNYRRQFKLFVCYSLRVHPRVVLSVENVLGFLEFLLSCGITPRVISNYCSAIKSYLSIYQVPVHWLNSSLLNNYLRALHIQVPTVRKSKSTLSLRDFLGISKALLNFDNHQVYRVAFMLSFYGFLRISNLVSPTQATFDPSRQLCSEDIAFNDSGVTVYLKWAKNLQRTEQSHVIKLPCMSNELLCPMRALMALNKFQCYSPSDPVIKIGRLPLTEAHLRKRLALVLKVLGLPTQSLTYHSLRRSGASIAFNNNVSFESIKNQGAWSSDAVWSYLFASSQRVEEVPRMFRNVELSL